MSTSPRLTYRFAHSVELAIHTKADVSAYQFLAANTLDAAFAGGTAMFTVPAGGTFRSPTIRKKKIGTSLYESRGLTYAHYDPEDYWAGGGTMPHDADGSYVTIVEQNAAGVSRPAGAILIVPPPAFFTVTKPNLTVAGTAPNVAATATMIPPAGALHFTLPHFADCVIITNNGGASLFVSFYSGLPEFEVLMGQSTYFPSAGLDEVFIRGNGMTVPFSAFFSIVNAEFA